MANLTVKLVRSRFGRKAGHAECIRGLGLRKIGEQRELEDTPAVRGMVNKVRYLVKIVSDEVAKS